MRTAEVVTLRGITCNIGTGINITTNKRGKKLPKESFGLMFYKACNQAGIKKSAYGLRKLAATRAANSGATISQLKAIFGWTDDNMASLYIKSADRKRLALEAIKAPKKLGIEAKKT